MPTGIAIVLVGTTPSIAVEFGGIGGREATSSEDEAGAEDKIGAGHSPMVLLPAQKKQLLLEKRLALEKQLLQGKRLAVGKQSATDRRWGIDRSLIDNRRWYRDV